MQLLKLTRTNNPAAAGEDEIIYLNSNEIRHLAAHPDGGAIVSLIHEEMPWQIRESCDEVVLQLRAAQA